MYIFQFVLVCSFLIHNSCSELDMLDGFFLVGLILDCCCWGPPRTDSWMSSNPKKRGKNQKQDDFLKLHKLATQK